MTSSRELGAMVALAIVLGSSAAAAAPPEPPADTIVEGRRASALINNKVSFGDLDLTRKAGERQLIRRISSVITRSCPSDSVLEKHQCRNQAWLKVRPQIKQAVYNARNMVGFVETVSMVIVVPAGENIAVAAQGR